MKAVKADNNSQINALITDFHHITLELCNAVIKEVAGGTQDAATSMQQVELRKPTGDQHVER